MSADLQFKQIIDRILRCREAEDAAKDDTKKVYAELKAAGYDKTAAGALVAELRKKDKNPDQFAERNAMLDLYRDAYDRAASEPRTSTPVRAREIIEEFPPHDAETGELADEGSGQAHAVRSEARDSDDGTVLPLVNEPAERSSDESLGTLSASDGGPEGSKQLQVQREPRNAAEPDVLAATREGLSMERGIDQCVTAGETATNSTGSAARGQAALSGECPEAPPTDEARKGPSGTAAPIRSPAITAGADGHRSIPRPDARVAGRGEAATSSVADAQSDQAVTHSKADDFDIGDVPAFLRRTDGYAAAAGRAEP